MNEECTPIKYTVIAGNPVDGFDANGLFDTNEEAVAWANTDAHLPDEWWVMPIYSQE